jgi:hypothetical protein
LTDETLIDVTSSVLADAQLPPTKKRNSRRRNEAGIKMRKISKLEK